MAEIDRATAMVPTTPPAMPPVPPLRAAPAITSSMSLSEAAGTLADQLKVIPGIDRYATYELGTLDERGPRPLRAAWRLARDRIAADYGEMTIGEFLARFGGGGNRAN